VRNMAGNAPIRCQVHCFVVQDLPGVTSQAVFIRGLYMMVRFVTLITIDPCHGHLVGECRPGRVPVTAETAFTVGNEPAWCPWGEGMAGHARCFLHSQTMDLPVLMAAQTGVPVRSKCMNASRMTTHARNLLFRHVPRMTD
jgi:hypothetical protein